MRLNALGMGTLPACIDIGDGIVRQEIFHHRLDRGLEEAILKLPEVLSWGDIDGCHDGRKGCLAPYRPMNGVPPMSSSNVNGLYLMTQPASMQ